MAVHLGLYGERHTTNAGWAALNGANAVSFVVVKHVYENFDNFWRWNNSPFTHFAKHKN